MVRKISSKERSRVQELMNRSLNLAGYTFALQVLLRIITFTTNGLAYRHVDTSILGLVNFRLGLYYSTLVFTVRESFRRACLSKGGEFFVSSNLSSFESAKKWRSLLNVMWLNLPVGLIVSIFLLPIWLFVLPFPDDATSSGGATPNQYTVCCLIYTVSAFLELMTEPLWLVCQLGNFLRTRIVLEAIANTARALGILGAIYLGDGGAHGLYLLAAPQILHGSTLLLGYFLLAAFGWFDVAKKTEDDTLTKVQAAGLRDFLPTFQTSLDHDAVILSWNFFRQGVLKQLLTEGERYLISSLDLLSFNDQGVYDLVSNLGSLAPRLIFSSVEESCHLLFSQCIQRDLGMGQQREALLRQAVTMLITSLRLLTLVAWVGCTFAQSYSRLLLFLFGGERFIAENPQAVTLLRIYALYLVLLAWNGPTEAFLNAALSTEGVSKHNFKLMGFSLVFLGISPAMVILFSISGLIWANCINMILRIVYSCYFIKEYLNKVEESCAFSASWMKHPHGFFFLRLMLPTWSQLVALLLALLLTFSSEYFLGTTFTTGVMFLHVMVGVVALLGVFSVILWQEKAVFLQLSETELGHIFNLLYRHLSF